MGNTRSGSANWIYLALSLCKALCLYIRRQMHSLTTSLAYFNTWQTLQVITKDWKFRHIGLRSLENNQFYRSPKVERKSWFLRKGSLNLTQNGRALSVQVLMSFINFYSTLIERYQSFTSSAFPNFLLSHFVLIRAQFKIDLAVILRMKKSIKWKKKNEISTQRDRDQEACALTLPKGILLIF